MQENNKDGSTVKETTESIIAEQTSGSKTLQLILVFIFSLVLFLVLSKPFKSFKSTDELPNIISITPQTIINFGGFPSEIVIGSYIREIGSLDIVSKTFDADLTIWFMFNPKSISLGRISQFTLDNAEIKYKSEPKTRAEGNNVVAVYDIKANIILKLDYKNFPFDDHIINFSITHYGLSPYEAIFESSKSNFMIDPKIKITGWDIIGKLVKTGFIEDTLNSEDKTTARLHPRTIFSIALHRIGSRHFITILIPLILIFFISLFTLAFDPTESTIGIAIASISAIVAQRFVIEDMSPKSNNLMISDKIFILFLTISCLIFFISIYSSKISGFYKNIITVLLYTITLIYILYIINPFS
ncbi:MAG: hypothetical protein UR12_C0002G0023 [candidate division TM6 bacterium GW2011_GWF2_30_66]|jgi:hypothetical protein|nr:MAG: hypothetical protein UR12_C0002G0023 [candidate division TM6 bacterium GW2011_GWF2_30_66]